MQSILNTSSHSCDVATVLHITVFHGMSPQEEVMVLERILLQTIKFDLQVEHPYQFLLRYAKQLKGINRFKTYIFLNI